MKIKLLLLTLTILTLIPLLTSTPLNAHTTTNNIGDYTFKLDTNTTHPKQHEQTQLTLTITDKNQQPITNAHPTIEILREKLTPQETKPGQYTTNYAFQAIGPIDINIKIHEHTEKTTIFITPPNLHQNHNNNQHQTNNTFPLTLAITFLIILTITTQLRINGKIELGTAITILLITATIILLVFGFNYYRSSEYNQGCFFNLPDGTKTYHCHQYVHIEICGEKVEFKREDGDLGRGHTHDDGYKIHWHPYNPTPTPEKDMTLRNLFNDLNLQLTNTTIQNPQNKTIHTNCNGKPATTTVYETLQHQTKTTQINNFLDYPLQDEATYNIKYS